MATKSVLFLVIAFSCVTCTGDFDSEDELRRYALDEGNGLRKKLEVPPYEVSVLYKPTDLLVLEEAQGNTESTHIEALRRKYNRYLYFILSFSRAGGEALTPATMTQGDFSELLQTIAFRMNDYLQMITPADTVAVTDFVYNRTFGMGNATDVLIVFDKAKIENQEWIEIKLREFGLGIGDQKIRFNVKDIENIPAMDFRANK